MPETLVLSFKKNLKLDDRVALVKSVFPSNLHEIFDGVIENAYLTGRVDALKELRTDYETDATQSPEGDPQGPNPT